MPERRIRGPPPSRQETRTPRTKARHASRDRLSNKKDKTMEMSGQSVATNLMSPQNIYNPPALSSKVHEIYVPPVIQEGLKGRDSAEYYPFSPQGGHEMGYWPKAANQKARDDDDYGGRRSSRKQQVRQDDYFGGRRSARKIMQERRNDGFIGQIAIPKHTMRQDDGDWSGRQNALKYSRTQDDFIGQKAKPKQKTRQDDGDWSERQNALKYTQTSDDERYNPEYRGMDDEVCGSDEKSRSSEGCSYEDSSTTRTPLPPKRKWYSSRFPFLSKSESESTVVTYATGDESAFKNPFAFVGSEEDYVTKQQVAWCTITLTAAQLLILMLQIAMCGFASFDINPMIGPFPDAFSQWGGKNPYLMLYANEWWRMVTPAFLHVGILHLVANVFCQLNVVAMFEREWGWFSWVFIYIMSTVGCSAASNWFDPDTIAVGSSGSLMGLFAAKLAQVVTFIIFDTSTEGGHDAIRLDLLSPLLCGLTIESVLGSFTYIDWSGNMGGLLSGFLAGLIVFSASIKGCCWRFWWAMLGLVGLVGSVCYIMYLYVGTSQPDEQLADPCEYFRSLFPEDYVCGCLWQ